MTDYRYQWLGIIVAGHQFTPKLPGRLRASRFNGRTVVIEVLRPSTKPVIDPTNNQIELLNDDERDRLQLPVGRTYLRLTNEYRLPWRINDTVVYLDAHTRPVVQLSRSSWFFREWLEQSKSKSLADYLQRTEATLDRRWGRLTELSVQYARYHDLASSLPDYQEIRVALINWYNQQFVRILRALGLSSVVVEAILQDRDPWNAYLTLLTRPWRLVYLDSETLLWLVRCLRLTVDNEEYQTRIAYQPLYFWLLQRGMIPWREVYQRLPNLQYLTKYRRLFGFIDYHDHATTAGVIETEAVLKSELTNRNVRHLKLAPAEPSLDLIGEQRRAVLMVANNSVSCLLGPAGTGKTTTIKAICELSDQVLLTSMTGKACRRLTEVCQRPAKTIHALLYRRIDDVELVVIDEVSMVGPSLLVRLLKRLPRSARLVLAGDFAQLPPVSEPSLEPYLKQLPTTELTTCHRSERLIYDNCSLLRQAGPVTFRWGTEFEYYHLTSTNSEVEVVTLWSQRATHHDFKVITPYRSVAEKLNSSFDDVKVGVASVIDQWDIRWFLGEKVMMTFNNYQVNVMNGDEGVVVKCGPCVTVEFEPEIIDGELAPRVIEYQLTGEQYHGYYEGADLTVLNTSMLLKASAITVHKAQGSEWDEVWCYLPWWSGFITRRLLYTALTRARQRVMILTTLSVDRLTSLLNLTND